MIKFVGYASNGAFSVGCTGQTVYLYNNKDDKIYKFQDIKYAYTPMISPDGKFFVVKSTDGRLAVYSLETFSLIKKFRFSKVASGQDDGCCFSSDGKLFLNVERQVDELRCAISIYNTADFSLVNQVLFRDNIMVNHIEFDQTTNMYYILGFIRNHNDIYHHGFVANFENNQVENIICITDSEYEFYYWYKHLEIRGFTQESYNWSPLVDCGLDKLKNTHHAIAKLHAYYSKKGPR